MNNTPQYFSSLRRDQLWQRIYKQFQKNDIIYQKAAEAINDRLNVITREFKNILVIGAPGHALLKVNAQQNVTICDTAIALEHSEISHNTEQLTIDHWDNMSLPLVQYDAVVSFMVLHSLNDAPGHLIQCHRSLVKDGVFLSVFIGGETHYELRQALTNAELSVRGGSEQRFMPLITLKDAGALLQRAMLALPVADYERLILNYSTTHQLLSDQKRLGLGNQLQAQSAYLSKHVMEALSSHYPQNDNGQYELSVDLIHMIGWRPDESQQKPLMPGSAETRLSDALGTDEHKTDALAQPH